MRDIRLLAGLIFVALQLPASAQQMAVSPAVSPPEISASVSLPGLQAQLPDLRAQPKQPERPASFRLNLAPGPLYSPRPDGAERVSHAGGFGPSSSAGLKLFEKGGISASVGNDGRIHYRLPAPAILGSQLSGQLSTNSARLTMIWRSKN